MNPVNYIFVHHTAFSYRTNPDQWYQTNEYHRELWNFKSSLGFYAGYNYEISANGTVRQARAEGEETAAVIGQNKNSVSVCLDGNFDIEDPTLQQKQALRKLLVEIMARHSNLSYKVILPHRSMCGIPPYKSCYGSRLADDWAQILLLSPEKVGVNDLVPPVGGTADVDREC